MKVLISTRYFYFQHLLCARNGNPLEPAWWFCCWRRCAGDADVPTQCLGLLAGPQGRSSHSEVPPPGKGAQQKGNGDGDRDENWLGRGEVSSGVSAPRSNRTKAETPGEL